MPLPRANRVASPAGGLCPLLLSPVGCPPLLPTAGVTCSHPFLPGSLPSGIPGFLDPEAVQFSASPLPPYPASLDRICRPTDRLFICLHSAHKLGTLRALPLPRPPTNPTATLSPANYLLPAPHIYLSSVNPSLRKPAEALPSPPVFPAFSQILPPPSLSRLAAQPHTPGSCFHSHPAIPHGTASFHSSARGGHSAGHDGSERGEGIVAKRGWVGKVRGSLSPGELNTSLLSYCNSNEHRATITTQCQTEIIPLFNAILSKQINK